MGGERKTAEQMNAERRAIKAKQKRGSTKQTSERFSLTQAIKERKAHQRSQEIMQWINQQTSEAIAAARKIGSYVVKTTNLKLLENIQARVDEEYGLSYNKFRGGIIIARDNAQKQTQL